MTIRLLTVCALCAPMLASQAFASGTNEYTLSDTDTNATITSYQTQPVQPSFQTQTTYQTQPAYQPPVADTGTSQFGELVFDTQPYFPNGDTGSTESYTTTTTETFAADAFTAQPYIGTTDTTTSYQPTYQAAQSTYQAAPQPTYQATQPSYQEPIFQSGQPTYQAPAYQEPAFQAAQPTYQPVIEQEDDSSWK